jgi:hypothetical protein
MGDHGIITTSNIGSHALTGLPSNAVTTAGGQTIGGTTYFSGGESLNLYGIRGRFTNEYIHLYNKVGIGHPSGWGEGQTETPSQGLSTYGGMAIAYGTGAASTFYGRIDAAYSSDRYQMSFRGGAGNYWWITNDSDKLGIHLNGTGDRIYFATDGNIWSAYYNDWLSNVLANKQNSSTAITTSNIGSQSVSYANSAGTAGQVSGVSISASEANALKTTLGVTSLPYSVDITVNGDADKFYAVQFWGGDQDVWRRIIIKRGYSEPAPWDPIGTGVHHGGLLLDWEGNFGGWGGAEYADRLRVFNESYTNVCADMFIWSHSMGYVFMLRGGGALYHLHSDQAINGYYQSGSPDILYSTSTLSYDDTWSGTNVYDVPAPAPLSLDQVNSTRIDGLRTKKQSLLDGRYLRQGIDISGIGNVSSTNFLASNAFYLNGTSYYLNSTNGGIYTNARFETAGNLHVSGSSQFNGNVQWFSGTSAIGLENQSTFARFAFNKLTFWDWNNGYDVMTIDGGYVESATSFRAPIFYDSNDAAYYVDPNSTSNLAASYIGRVLINYDGTDTWFRMQSGNRMRITTTGGTDFIIPNTGEMTYNGNTVIHAGNIGSQSVSYATTSGSATTAGSAPNAGNLNTSYGVTAGAGNGLKFWNGEDTYKISMGNSDEYHYGPVTDYSIKTVIDSVGATRGFTWGQNGVTPIAALNVGNGNMQIAGAFTASNFSGSSSGTNTGDQTNISGNAATATRTSGQSGYPFAGTGMFAFYNWGGNNGGASAPNDGSYTVGISVGSNPGDQAYGFQIGRNMWNDGLWTRGYDSGWREWVRLIDSTNIGSQSVASATSASYADSIYFNGVQKLYGGSDGTRNTGWAYHTDNGTGIHWPNNGWHIYPINASDMYIRSGASDCSLKFTKNGTSGSYVHCSADNDIGFLTTGRSWSLRVDNSGNAFATSSFRAPIFYDSDDTGYYVDPNGTSNLSRVLIPNASSGASLIVGINNTSRVIDDNARKGLVVNADYYPHIYVNALSSASNDVHGAVISMTGVLSAGGYRRWGMGIANTDPSALSWGWWDNESNPHYSVGGTLGYTSTGARMWLNTDGVLQTTGSMRAPIFYDSNDTNYYVDPASGSNLYGGNGSFVIQGTWPQLRIAQNDGTPDASINYDAGDGYRKWNVGPGAGEAEGDEFGFAIYEGTRGTLYSTPLRINALTGYVQIGDRDRPDYQLDVSGYGYFRDNIGVATTPRSDAYKISMGGSIHLNGNSVDYVGSLYLEGSGTGGHLQPNAGSYGTLQITGSKSGWAGLRFTDSAVTLMMNTNESGHHNDNYGWQFRWENGTLYCHKNSYGGGTAATVLDSSNYSSWAQPASTAINTGNIGSQSVDYANRAAYLPTLYNGGVQANPQTYFGQSVGLRVAMTGSWSVWSDTLWINGYSGGDVKSMCALHFLRNGQPRFAISTQNHDGDSYGEYYEVVTSYNIGSQSVNYATSAGNADTVDGKHATNNASNLAVYESNGYLYIPSWMNVNGGGIFSSTNNAHIRPNTASYGAWEMIGSRNGWSGIYFNDSGDYLMANNNEVGHYQNGVGWKFRWYQGQMYVSRNNTGGGTEYTVLDSGNYSSWAIARNGDTVTSIINFQTNNGGRSGATDSAKLQAYSTSNNSAFMSFHKAGHYAVNMGLDDDNVLRIGGWSASANRMQLDMSGNVTFAGDVTAYSDARVKENVKTIENALDKTLKLRGVSYNRIDSDDKSTKIGVIAQEILDVVPEVVNQDNDGMYNVSYGNITALLIEAIKEQQKQIEELKSIINGLTR